LDPLRFRRDPWLRTIGYHLATWSLAALVLELERASPTPGSGPSSIVVVLGATVLVSLTHERRVAKMAGIASDPVDPRVSVLVTTTLAALVLATAAFAYASLAHWIVTAWLAGIGAMLLVWSSLITFEWLGGVGATLVGASLADAALLIWRPGSDATVAVRMLVLGIVVPLAGVLTSRRFLWFRAQRDN
jgi:hypothetical protein